MRLSGIALIVILSLIPLIWYVPMSNQFGVEAMLSQYMGSVALILMGLAHIMATRAAGIERLLGGLDRIYVLHKWVAIIALGTILLHENTDPEVKGLPGNRALSDFAESLGDVSLNGLLVLIIISVLTFIPYNLWRWSHRLMGVFFILGALHFALIIKPADLLSPLSLYVLAFCVAGAIGYFYLLIPFRLFQGKHTYEVRTVEPTGDAFAIELKPQNKGMKHKAGQFAFIQFDAPGLTEVHPFTLSSAPNKERTLRFSIKKLGDFTNRLPQKLQPGTKMRVQGPFGHFTAPKGHKPTILLAGGIGITPFLAWLNALEAAPKADMHLFYCVQNQTSAPHLKEVQNLCARFDNVHLHLIESQTMGRLTAAKIIEIVGNNLSDHHAYFCGPEPMRENLKKGLQPYGLKSKRFHYEQFEIRTGIGITRLLKWIWKKVAPTARAQIAKRQKQC